MRERALTGAPAMERVEERRGPDGSEKQDWFEAEEELRRRIG